MTASANRPHRDPGRKPVITGGRVEQDGGQIVTSAGAGRMVGNVILQERVVEEAPVMPTPTQPLSTSAP